VATSDTSGTVADSTGLDVAALAALKEAGRTLHDYCRANKLGPEAILDVDCDIWIPAARPDVINAGNVHRLKTCLVAQGANIPCTPEAEEVLYKRGALVVPDVVGNAGGVICAAIEYRGGTERAAFDSIAERIRANTRLVLDEGTRSGKLPRSAALALAERSRRR
jgi:glutamate dehydrogenase (NAD(P)+)